MMQAMNGLLVPCLVAVLLVGAAAQEPAQECSGHGAKKDGKCQCATPKPTSGEPGWVWDDCNVSAAPMALDTSDVAASGSTLDAGQTKCFYAEADLFSLPTHLALAHTLKSGSGPLDVVGLLVAEVEGQPTPYPTASTPFSFVMTSMKARPDALLQLDQSSAGTKASGLYLCVSNKGPDAAEFALRGATHTCPFKLLADGSEVVCSSSGSDKRYAGDKAQCPTGMCTCDGRFARPEHVAVFAGLGFEDCSAAVATLAPGGQASSSVDSQPPNTWQFFAFQVDPADRSVWVTATATANTTSTLELYLRFWQPPGRTSPAQYDAASAPLDFRHRSRQDLSLTVDLEQSPEGQVLRPGLWYAGAYVSGSDPVTYTLQLNKAPCPHGCAGPRGVCQMDGSCNCTSSDFMGADCSHTCTTLDLGTPRRVEPRVGWDEEMLTLKGVETLLEGGTMWLRFEATLLVGPSPALPPFVTERPVLLLSGNGEVPGWETAMHRLFLEQPDTKVTFSMPGSEVVNGTVYAVLYNPVSSPYSIGYELTVTPEAHCVADCSGHGSCDANTGHCLCQEGFAGTDCSVDTRAFTNTTAPCQEGSLRKAFDVDGGHTYSVCVCAPGGAEGPGACDFVTPLQEGSRDGVVLCAQGYHLQGAQDSSFALSDGSRLATGGVCAAVPKRGVSGGMVFFYCLLSVVLAAGMAFSSKYVVAIWDVYVLPELQSRGWFRGRSEGYTSLFDGFGGRTTDAAGNNDAW